jgi:molybdopterin converting factor small subunit
MNVDKLVRYSNGFQRKHASMKVTVELFGIPRLRAGVAQTEATGATLGDVFCDLAQRFPELGETCMMGRSLRAGFTANLRGEQFLTDPATTLREGDTILLLSMDAGG